MAVSTDAPEADRRTRKRQRSRVAILDAAAEVMADKGIAEATMAEISEQADVALGTLYNHFTSKHDLAMAVVDAEIEQVAKQIEERAADFADPAMVFAHGCRTVMAHATANDRWRQLLDTPGVMAESFYEGFGPYALRDIRRAEDAGRFHMADAELAWRLSVWAIIGYTAAVCAGQVTGDSLDEAVTAILGIVGMEAADATALVTALPT